MRILVSPDSFKDCLSAELVSAVIADELSRCRPDWEIIRCPLSDGGEGFHEILTAALGGETVRVTVTGPLGEPVECSYGRVGDTAILDVASCCGLQLVPPERRNPLKTTTRGLGELMMAAWKDGCSELIIGLGGSANCDGGEGMLSVEGIKDLSEKVSVDVLCDVRNPFVGPDGAARVFGPQKGAFPEEVEALEERMLERAAVIEEETGIDVSFLPGTGAAGGLAGALYAYFEADMRPGIAAVLDYLDYENLVKGADWIVTGEGRSDSQTLSGKVPMGVLLHAGEAKVALLSGSIRDREALEAAGFARLIEVTPPGDDLSEALMPERAEANLRRAVQDFLEWTL